MVGDYGTLTWVDGDGNIAARAGGGGFDDFTDGVVRSIHKIYVVWPPLENLNEHQTNFFDSGEANIL